MKIILVLLLALNTAAAMLAQDKGRFSFEIGGGIQQVGMCKLNQLYIDSIAKRWGYFKSNIKSTNQGFVAVRYQPSNLFDIGLYGSYQKSELKGNPIFYSSDETGNTTANSGTSSLLIQSIGYGLTSNIHFNHILKWNENAFLKRCRLISEIRIGNSISNATVKIHYPTLDPIASNYTRFGANAFEGHAALKFEYDYLKMSLASAIGFRVGYCYLNTKTLKNQFGEEWKVLNDKAINLNLSGWFASIYLVFAK